MYAVVRHAHAGSKKAWPGSDERRPLTGRGLEQALGLAPVLAPLGPVQLLTSPYLRCEQTLRPLAEEVHRPVLPVDVLRPSGDGGPLARFLGQGVVPRVLCTHGETLRALLAVWTADPVRELRFEGPWPEGGRTRKGAAWLVDEQDDARTLHYVVPQHAGPVPQEA